jgi:predicted ATPase
MLGELQNMGFRCAPEVARQIIREQVQSGGAALPWGDRKAYTELMLQRSIASFREHTPAADPVFSDRGIPDILAYARLIALADAGAIENACRSYRYAGVVFMAPPWPDIYQTDSERKQDLAEARFTYEVLTRVYSDFGYELVDLPLISPADRARFLVDRLHLKRRASDGHR